MAARLQEFLNCRKVTHFGFKSLKLKKMQSVHSKKVTPIVRVTSLPKITFFPPGIFLRQMDSKCLSEAIAGLPSRCQIHSLQGGG